MYHKITEHVHCGINIISRAIIICDDHVLLSTPTQVNKEFAQGTYYLPGGHVDYNMSLQIKR